MHTHMHTHARTHTHMRAHTRACTHAHTHTHTHTHTRVRDVPCRRNQSSISLSCPLHPQGSKCSNKQLETKLGTEWC